VTDAYTWVNAQAAEYGAIGKPTVFGQSAGGHLAAYLAVQQPQSIDRAVLFYAPLDFEDFGAQIQNESYTNGTGIGLIGLVTGSDPDTVNLESSVITHNTFSRRVEPQPNSYPPMFMLHGGSDSLLPARQSIRMCNALSGSIDNGPVPYTPATDAVSHTYNCDSRGSQLHLIPEGEHTLDLCLSDELCLAGSPESAAAVANALDSMLSWSEADDPAALNTSDNGGNSGSGQLSLWMLLVLMLFLNYKRHTLFGCQRKEHLVAVVVRTGALISRSRYQA